MLKEYDFSNAVKNPYAARLKAQKQQITINIDGRAIEYFKSLAETTGIPYQTLINMYLTDCADNKKQLKLTWE